MSSMGIVAGTLAKRIEQQQGRHGGILATKGDTGLTGAFSKK